MPHFFVSPDSSLLYILSLIHFSGSPVYTCHLVPCPLGTAGYERKRMRYYIFEHLSRKELTRETLHSSLVSDELTKRKLGFKLRTGAPAQAGRNSQYKLGARSFTWPRVSHRSFLQKTQFSTSKLPKFTAAWAYLTPMLTWLQSVLTIRRFRLRQGVIRNSSQDSFLAHHFRAATGMTLQD